MNANEIAYRKLGPVLWLCLFLVNCGTENDAEPGDLSAVDIYSADPMALERGRALYVGSCATFCHDVETANEAVDLFDCEWRHGSSADELFDVITNGIADTRMVGFGENFPEGREDTWRLVAYLLSNQYGCAEPVSDQPVE